MVVTEIKRCRICGNSELESALDLGRQAMTGVFPRPGQKVSTAPLQLVKCKENPGRDSCGLVQLRHSCSLSEMYGDNYGYRSGLNASMVRHLRDRVKKILTRVSLAKGDLVVDIGSNDSTLLQGYSKKGLKLVGVDPTGKKFRSFYPPHIDLIPDFFSAQLIQQRYGRKKAKVITSISMFYDLESPLEFMRQVRDLLSDEGVWVLEQSYLPLMLDMNAYDTICHEHLEYYGLRQIKWMTDRLGLKIVDVELNSTNGGSFALTVARSGSRHPEATSVIDALLRIEEHKGMSTLRALREFADRVTQSKKEVMGFLKAAQRQNKKVFAYGASTKGNVVLQYCGVKKAMVPMIAEVNPDKFGRTTPAGDIPIVSEDEARALRPDFFLVLPWHFRKGILEREKAFLKSGGRLVFPLPNLEVLSA